MTKLQVLQGLATFAMSCEANGVEFFYNYNPNSNAVYCHVYEGGKRTDSNGLEFSETIYFEDGNLESDLKKIIETVIDKYYKKG
jgi:hypothetical protein